MTLFGFLDFGIIDFIDIVLVSLLLFYSYRLARGTVAINIFLGIVIVYVMWKITEVLQMELLSSIFGKFIGVGFFALIVVFQEEIRKFLLMLGSNTSSFSRQRGLGKLFDFVNKERPLPNITTLLESCKSMSKKYVGALIVLERSTSLDYLEQTGDCMQIELDQTILESFFDKNSPLHDGAIIVRGNTIIATRVILPLTDSRAIPHRYGLRHRAAIGVTERTDALALTVSEETGTISYMREGRFVIFNSIEDLKKIIAEDLSK